MNGGSGNGEGSTEEMEEDGREELAGQQKEKVVLMWGYLPGVSPQRSPLLYPSPVSLPESSAGDTWKDVCGGGCGFAMALSETGKILTWGSVDDMGASYVTSGKHEEIPEAFPLPNDIKIVEADAGWAHCAAITDRGEVYTWGWKECVPTGRLISDQNPAGTSERETDQVSPRSQVSKSCEEGTKRRKVASSSSSSSTKPNSENSISNDENLSAPPCVVTFNSGVRIVKVAAGGRHTLALSDVGQVWGWGYGGEGQLGLGSRIRSVSSPHPIPCVEFYPNKSALRPPAPGGNNRNSEGQLGKVTGTCVRAIACGGRHSAVVTDSGALVTFGWGLYGQCGQGCTDDLLSPTCVTSILGVKMKDISAGLWHTVCTSVDGDVYSFGGNQFGQLGTGSDQAETVPKLVEASCLETKNAKSVSCGARHSAIITDDGVVFCWGWNKYGQLGLGDAIDRNVPSQVQIESHRPLNVSCGWWHTLVLAESPT
ncbi:hypothetical protein LUZ60_010887 [Juncus effusus]|nr:hypothetical protein LUZ60_010887 [Juncus effusus]